MEEIYWQEVAGRICRKTAAVAAESAEKIPYSTQNGRFDDQTGNISWWTNGFWAGQLWQLYGAFGGENLREIAEKIEGKLDRVFLDIRGMDHDSGFRWLMTAGANWRLTGSETAKNRLILAANDLAGRFNLAGNFIRAWNDLGDGSKAGWAIIDCMMNLPLLYIASEILHDPRFSQIAIAHADTAMRAFVRPDGSVCHIVEFDPTTGERLEAAAGKGTPMARHGRAGRLGGCTASRFHTFTQKSANTSKQP